MNIFKLQNSIFYTQDVLKILTDYAETMDTFFSNMDNQLGHKFCYDEYILLTKKLKESAEKRGLFK